MTATLLERDDLRHLGSHRLSGELEVFQLGDGDHPAPRTASARRGNLPRGLVQLVGRDADLDDVTRALEAAPVVTLTGPGGVGKTALALAAARGCQAEGRHRVWLVELAEITAPEAVPRVVADTLGVVEGTGHDLTDSCGGPARTPDAARSR